MLHTAHIFSLSQCVLFRPFNRINFHGARNRESINMREEEEEQAASVMSLFLSIHLSTVKWIGESGHRCLPPLKVQRELSIWLIKVNTWSEASVSHLFSSLTFCSMKTFLSRSECTQCAIDLERESISSARVAAIVSLVHVTPLTCQRVWRLR